MDWRRKLTLPSMLMHRDQDAPDLYHTSSRCINAKRRGRVELGKVIAPADLTVRFCYRSTCQEVMPADDLHDVLEYSTLHRNASKMIIGKDPVRDLTGLGPALEKLQEMQGRQYDTNTNSGRVSNYIRGRIQEHVTDLTNEMRQSTWTDALRAHTLKNNTDAETLKAAGLQGPGSPGLVVGTPPRRRHDVGNQALLHVLAGGKEGKLILTGPSSTLLWLVLATTHDGYVGEEVQLVDLPADYDHDMEEIILALFEPGSEGPMSRLPEVITIARRILGER